MNGRIETHPQALASLAGVRVTGIYIYPVKSLRGIVMDKMSVDSMGPIGDRRFLVVDEQGRFITQREQPRMALIDTALDPGHLTLATNGFGSVRVALTDPGAPLCTVTVWKHEGLQAEDCGNAAAEWLGNYLGIKCRLVRAGAAFNRTVSRPGRSLPDDVVGFADGYPFLIVSEASLADLNQRLAERDMPALPINRFRPNLVVAGCLAFAEDNWSRFRIGSITFRAGGPCARCGITVIDQFTATLGKEPLRTLATFRRDPDRPAAVNFGRNVCHDTKSGTLQVGDCVEFLV